jgi:hypothetical protein
MLSKMRGPGYRVTVARSFDFLVLLYLRAAGDGAVAGEVDAAGEAC